MELTPLILDRFKRVNDKLAPDLIGQDELVTLTDAVLDYKIGKPVKRGHFSRYDAGATAGADILKLIDVKSSAGQQHIIAAVADELREYNPATNNWADVIATGTLTTGFKFRHVPFSDKFIFTFDTNNDPMMVDNDLATTWNLELGTATVTAIQSFHDNGGALTQNAMYKYIIVGVTEDGQLSPPSRPFTHLYSTARSLTTDNDTSSTKIFFKNLPYIADSRIVSRYLFRTKAEISYPITDTNYTGEVYYLLATLDNDYTGTSYQTEFDDNTADDDLGTEIVIYLNTPTRAKFIAYSNERLILGNFSQTDINHFSPPSTQTGGTPPSGYTDGYELAIADATAASGTLDDSTAYDYKIHWVDEFGRLSKYYHQIGTTTSAGTGADDHHLTITGIGVMDRELGKNSRIKIYRQTGGTGDYYLILDAGISEGVGLAAASGKIYFPQLGSFGDYGVADGTEVWVDPATQINAYPSAICFSEVSSPSTIRDEDKRQIYPDDGNEITGLFDDQDGVVVFKTNSINKVFISGNPINWRLVQLCRNYGCDQPETIQKSGSSYYFIYQNKAYRYDYGAEKPVDIGVLFQGTLSLATTFYDSTINDRWYCIQCLLVSTPYTLVYDMKLDTWYKFKRTQSGSEDFKTIYFTKYGSPEQLLSNADDYVTLYNDITDYSVITRADTEVGTTQQISPVIRTKTFKSPDGITLTRLRKLKFDYRKLDGQNVTVTITDDDIPSTIVLTDSTNSSNANYTKLYESGIGRDTDTLKETRSFYVTIQGAGLERFDSLRIEGRPIHKGKQVSA